MISAPALRGHPACPYFDDDQKYVGRFPAVIAPITGPDGELQSVQRIYVAEVEKRKKALAGVKGGAVRLAEPVEGVLGCAEGVVTALSASELFHVPVWSLLDAANLEAFAPPDGLTRLLIFGDCDRSFTGQDAAYGLARRMRGRASMFKFASRPSRAATGTMS
jgi:putative DNA primase/helicase